VVRHLLLSGGIVSVVTGALLLAACGGSSGGSGNNNSNPTSNVQAISVSGGPVAGQIYTNGAFTSVTICAPGTSTCQTVGGVLVDTGSIGLRVLASAIPGLNLPQLTGSGTELFNCVSFVDGSFLWGPVAQADVKIAGEVASGGSVQVIQDPTGFSIPTTCSNGNANIDNQVALGANGILGVGPEPVDCGFACDPASGITPPNVYFACSTTGNCQVAQVALAQQVVNPVVLFPTDNNGVIVQMQSLGANAATASGSLIFGIGTQSNNTVPSTATVFTMDDFDNFTTNFNQQSLNASFIDSGSNGFFFPDGSIPQCAGTSIAPGFFCPASVQNLSAQNVGANGKSSMVNFSVDNAINLFQSNPSDAAFPALGGPNGSGTCSAQNTGACSFDWGLPFFYGRMVFSSIDGQAQPTGLPAAPWWAY